MNNSKIYKFLDEKHNFTIHFLEGQKLISDLSTIHHNNQKAFLYLRDCVLTFMPFIGLLKNGEGLGLYIDNDDPYFRFKLETNYNGNLRTLILPEELESIPNKLNGRGRITKLYDGGRGPYTSIVELKNIPFSEMANIILKDSYQVNDRIILSDYSDQSLKIAKLPTPPIDPEAPIYSTKEYLMIFKSEWNDIFKMAYDDEEEIIKSFADLGAKYIGGHEINFHCPCSKERMLYGVLGLKSVDLDELFNEQENAIEAKCDYCHKVYHISKDEINQLKNRKDLH